MKLLDGSWARILWVSFVTAVVIVPTPTRSAETDEDVVVGKRFTIKSNVLNEARSYLVHTPYRYEDTESKYPVLIVLDASTQFAHTSEAVEFLAANGRSPQMLVVGIENTHRGRDMTPSIVTPGASAAEGGADKFLTFIASELIPEIDRKYRTHSYRVLVGHSLSGLFTLYAVTKQKDTFNAYLSISPFLPWDKSTLVTQMDSFLTTHKHVRADLYVSMGNETGDMLGSAWKLSGVLAEKAPAGLRWRFERRPEESHGSNPYLSVYDGLKAIFDGWYVEDSVAQYKQIGLKGMEAHYEGVSTRMGYKVDIPESALQGVFQMLMRQQRYAEAEVVVKKGLESYSKRFPFNRAATVLYTATKDDQRVIEYSTNILKMFPGNAEARRTLEKHKVDVAKIVPAAELSPKALASYVGRFVGPNVFAEISQRDGKLYVTTNEERIELRAKSAQEFYGNNADVEITFGYDKRGKIDGLVLDVRDTTYKLTRRN